MADLDIRLMGERAKGVIILRQTMSPMAIKNFRVAQIGNSLLGNPLQVF